MAASIPLERARALEPDKSSIREALGRAYFRSARFEQAAEEFAARRGALPGERLRALLPGPVAGEDRAARAEARRHAVLAAGMRPDRADYRAFRDRLRRRLGGCLSSRRRRAHGQRRLDHAGRAGGPRRARRPPPPAGRRAPRCRASACTRSAPAGSGGSTRAASRGPARLAGVGQRERLGAQQPVGDPQAHVERATPSSVVGRHGDAPLAVGEPRRTSPGSDAR